MHAVPRYVRIRRVLPDEQTEWSDPLEMQLGVPMTLVHMDDRVREDLWPSEQHRGLPVLLPGGEEGRLVRFDHAADGSSWSYTLEFRGASEG